MRNKGAMMSDPTIREGFVQSSVAQGMQAAGSNTSGAANAFMGMGMGMNAAGGFMSAASQTNAAQMAQQQAAQQAAQGGDAQSNDNNNGGANGGSDDNGFVDAQFTEE